MSEKDEDHRIEGYKALMQYGIQMSQDHVNYDKILTPVVFLPAYFVLTSSDLQDAGPLLELVIWAAGPLLLWFWHARNKRSRARLYKVWDTVACIEKDLKLDAMHIVLDHLNKSSDKRDTLRDFEIKKRLIGFAALGYVVVFCYVLWRWLKC